MIIVSTKKVVGYPIKSSKEASFVQARGVLEHGVRTSASRTVLGWCSLPVLPFVQLANAKRHVLTALRAKVLCRALQLSVVDDKFFLI